jgi:hypothetical protein
MGNEDIIGFFEKVTRCNIITVQTVTYFAVKLPRYRYRIMTSEGVINRYGFAVTEWICYFIVDSDYA